MLQPQIRLRAIGKCLTGTPTAYKCAWGITKNQLMSLSSVSLAYDDYNSKTTSSASPILLSHGMLGSRSNWTSIAKQIHKTTGRRVVAVDARNHGDSPHTDEMCYTSMAKDLEKLIIELRLGHVSLVGHRYEVKLRIFKIRAWREYFVEVWEGEQQCSLLLLQISHWTK